ncbi:MAG: rhodanese-like domain-containing protein [Tannerella sp.]|jgi:rhodanese-related sulfurtransferase|nr:rhodanese-like domain-containing protein [Tannerella sp.]
MKKLVYLASFALMFPCRAFSSGQDSLKEIARHDSTRIVDVRTPEEFESGHIERSVNIPLDVISEHAEQLKPYAHVIVVCRSGRRSAQAKKILEDMGFNVYDGGGWEAVEKMLQDAEDNIQD